MFNNQGKTLLLSAIILLLVAILLAVTNPDKDHHIQAITDSLSNQNAISSVLNRGILTVDPPSYHSAIVFSYTKKKDKMTTLGILNYVWVDEKAFK